jgi:hypothetical protein
MNLQNIEANQPLSSAEVPKIVSKICIHYRFCENYMIKKMWTMEKEANLRMLTPKILEDEILLERKPKGMPRLWPS